MRKSTKYYIENITLLIFLNIKGGYNETTKIYNLWYTIVMDI